MLLIPRCLSCQNQAEYFCETGFQRFCLFHKDNVEKRYKINCNIPASEIIEQLTDAKNRSKQSKMEIYSSIIKTSSKLMTIIKDLANEQIKKIDGIIEEVDERINDFYNPKMITDYLNALKFYFSNDTYFLEIRQNILPFFKMIIPKFPEEDKEQAPQENIKYLKLVRYKKFKSLVTKAIPNSQENFLNPIISPKNNKVDELDFIDTIELKKGNDLGFNPFMKNLILAKTKKLSESDPNLLLPNNVLMPKIEEKGDRNNKLKQQDSDPQLNEEIKDEKKTERDFYNRSKINVDFLEAKKHKKLKRKVIRVKTFKDSVFELANKKK